MRALAADRASLAETQTMVESRRRTHLGSRYRAESAGDHAAAGRRAVEEQRLESFAAPSASLPLHAEPATSSARLRTESAQLRIRDRQPNHLATR